LDVGFEDLRRTFAVSEVAKAGVILAVMAPGAAGWVLLNQATMLGAN
jgi:hypothetical protein